MTARDTIAARATASGQAALAIVRLSGPEAIRIADACVRGPDLSAAPANTIHFGHAVHADGVELDQVMAAVFRAPHSPTGEDVVEISCHGGDLAPRFVLDALLSAGARMARPGEFTERAFLGGKLDLAQAEAVADLIHASSSLAHRVSLGQLRGRYSDVLHRIRTELTELLALVELELDFAEEDVAFADKDRLQALMSDASVAVDRLLSSARTGDMVRDGVRVVIAGRPNAGKSTLLNALVGRNRAIVSASAGTTRDEIEAEVEFEGVRFRFVDTAGIRVAGDAVEQEGVRRAREAMERADVLLYVFDAAAGLDEEEVEDLRALTDRRPQLAVRIVANKADLLNGEAARKAARRAAEEASAGGEGFDLVARRADDDMVRPLMASLRAVVQADLSGDAASTVVTNQRQRHHLHRAAESLLRARSALAAGASGDVFSVDLRAALNELGAIVGEVTNEDVLGAIFSRFCIGK